MSHHPESDTPNTANAQAPSHGLPPNVPAAPRQHKGLSRWALYALAIVFLALGVIGAFVPGMPTTVFILMSAWAAARSSPRLHRWLRNHKLFGSILRNWEAGGFVSRKAKKTAALTMLISVLIMLAVGVAWWATALASFCMLCVAIWLWRRPEPPAQNPPPPSA